METFRFIEAFRALRTTDARQHALDALVGELTPHEWRALHTVTGARTFQLDIVGQLPLELAAQIFSLVDIVHPYRLQLVSRRWRRDMSSMAVLQAGLQNWYHNTVDLRYLDYPSCVSMVQRIHAFRTFKPRSHFVIRLNRFAIDPVLTGDIIIWKPVSKEAAHVPRSICLLNMTSWSFRELRGDAREAVHSFVASNELVAMMTSSNICYVWELHGEGFKKFKVPSGDFFYSTTCRQRVVACAALTDDALSVYIWHFDTQRGHSFQISRSADGIPPDGNVLQHRSQALILLLQPKSSSIIIMTNSQCYTPEGDSESNLVRGPPVSIQFTYSGECLSRSYLSPNDRYSSVELPSYRQQLIAVDRQGHFAIKMECRTLNRDYTSTKLHLEFDENLNQFNTTGDVSWTLTSQKWWNDTYTICPEHEESVHDTLITTMGNTSGFKKTVETTGLREDWKAEFNSSVDYDALINENYVVRNLYLGLAVFAFGESKGRPKQSGAFFDEGEFAIVDFKEIG